MAGKTKHGLPETKGTFQLSGIVSGVESDNFFKTGKTKNGSTYRIVNFGVEIDRNKKLFVSLFGMPQKEVFFYKSGKKGESATTKNVDWNDRNKFKGDGYRLIGMNLGLTKKKDENGKEVNDKQYLTPYDGALFIKENLQDGMHVFIKGKIEYSHFKNDSGEIQRMEKLVPQQISLCKEIDFSADGFEPTANFTQEIVFTGIDKEDVDGETEFYLSSNIVTYSGIEQASFTIKNPKLAGNFKKNISPFSMIKVWGDISLKTYSESVEDDSGDDDTWGESNDMDRMFASYSREFLITGADPKTIDNETYSEESIAKAIAEVNKEDKASSEFADNESWGDDDDDSFDDDGWDVD